MQSSTGALTGRVALVTGGGRGIGQAIAAALAGAGAAVAVVARGEAQVQETAAALRQSGARVLARTGDVARPDDVDALVRAAEDELGPIDILVNNAATLEPLGPLDQVDPAQWWQAMEINVRGPFLCARAVLPGMVARRRGRILNIVSGTGQQSFPNMSAYCVSKTALVRLTESLDLETRAHGLAAFALDPGTVVTAMTDWAAGSPEGQRWTPWFAGYRDQFHVPAARVADLALALASGEYDVLSGSYLAISDDLAALRRRAEEIARDGLLRLRLRT